MFSEFKNLDKAFENKVRLGIMSILMMEDQISFNGLKEALKLTDGNLASHIKALEKLNYISVLKTFIERKPNTTYSATKVGIKAFQKHLDALEAMLREMNK
ncbi:MAG: transcriptional regulator [Saprospiraceae bacterium]|nr:transcriptional regulator [Bacteroidia bacterium]NNE13538.1 transcriptional regulator [Saprospiraceae bacterium]NNL93086.1 transcriptional regulator [Saprospiraceae bacterium]